MKARKAWLALPMALLLCACGSSREEQMRVLSRVMKECDSAVHVSMTMNAWGNSATFGCDMSLQKFKDLP